MKKPAWPITIGCIALAALGVAAWIFLRAAPSPEPVPKAPAAAVNPLLIPAPLPRRPSLPDATKEACPIRLHEVTKETGITFVHTDGSSGSRYVVESMSTGIATFDYDGDGLIDIYLPNGAPLPGYKSDRRPQHALYRNLGGRRFQDVSREAGVVCTGFGMGIGVGDYDNDGRPDFYLSNFGPNFLYHNNGNGTFSDVTKQAGVQRPTLVGAGICFLDADRDGLLDLYVGNYMDLDLAAHKLHYEHGIPHYPSPNEYDPVPDNFFHNSGDGSFADFSEPSGIAAHKGRSMGMTCGDFDNDGGTDIFICNDVMENFLFRNDGAARFEQTGMIAGVATSPQGDFIANMAVDCADYDHDGWLDLYTTNYQGQWPMLLHNLGGMIFEDVTLRARAGEGMFNYVNWGCAFVDFDNDGHRDLFIANGHTEDNMDVRDPTTCTKCPNVLLWNTGKGSFVNVSSLAGDGMKPVEASRSTAFEDLDNDGDIDAVIMNWRASPTIIRNMLRESGNSNHWLQLRLVGTKTNRDGVGARVIVVAGDLRQTDEVHSGRGYQSHWGSRLHFGLGRRDRVDRVEVRWMGGGADVFENVPVDRLSTLVEGTGRPVASNSVPARE